MGLRTWYLRTRPLRCDSVRTCCLGGVSKADTAGDGSGDGGGEGEISRRLFAGKEKAQPGQYGLESRGGNPPYPLLQIALVYGDDLRYIHHARFGKSGIALFEYDVSRSGGTTQVGSDQADYGCGDVAAIEGVALNNDAGMALSGGGTRRRAKAEPIHITLPDLFHHWSWIGNFAFSFRPSRRSCASGVVA